MREIMHPEVSKGNLAYEFDSTKGTLVNFAEVSVDDTSVTGSIPLLSQQRVIPLLSINPDVLADANRPLEILHLVLEFDHSFSHYLQWVNGSPEIRRGFRLLPQGKNDSASKTTCEHIWHNEYEAYEHECALAVGWNVPEIIVPGLCMRLATPAAFAQFLFFKICDGPGKLVPECGPTWAKLAGHPEPIDGCLKFNVRP